MVNTYNLIRKLSGTPRYGSLILCSESELQESHTINEIQIYIDNGKYYFKYPEDNDIYICIGVAGVCDKMVLMKNFAKIISALGLKTNEGKLVPYYDEEEEEWWYNKL